MELDQDVIGVDSDEDRVRQLAEVLSQSAQIDATDLRALKEVGVQDVDVAVISIGENIEASLLVVMQVMELGVNEVIAKAVTPLHGRILQKLGVKRVIYPERDMAIRVAHSPAVPNSRDFSIVEIPAPKEFVGQSLKQLELRPRYGPTLIAVKRRSEDGKGEVTNIAPLAEEVIEEGDVLSLLGANDRLAQLSALLPK
jgi:trk system potassium uptake protein